MTFLSLTVLGACQPTPSHPFARGYRIDSLDQGIGGPKAMARPGDFVLENDHLRIAVLGARNSMGPGLYGGALVDADLQWYSPETSGGMGRDQFGELVPTVNMNVAHPEQGDVELIADGSDGGAAILRVTGPAEPFITLLDALWALVGAPDFWLITDYVVEPGVPWVTLRTTAVVDWDGTGELPTTGAPVDYPDQDMPVLDWAIESGLVLGEFYLSGGGVDVFAPGMGFDEDGEVYRSWQRGENTFLAPYRYPFLAGVSDGVSYGIAPADGNLYVPLFTASQTAAFGGGAEGIGPGRFPPGTALSYERYFFVGHGDVGSVVDRYLEARGQPAGQVSGRVVEEGTGLPMSGVHVFAYEPGAERPWSQWHTDGDPRDDVADGSFAGSLPVGEWELLAHRHGRPDSARIPVSVSEGEQSEVILVHPRPGLVRFQVRDDRGRPTPAKLTLFRLDDDPARDPILGDGFVAGDPEMVLFPLYGDGEVELPDGRYQAVATRGLEYEWDLVEFEVDAKQEVSLDLTVRKVVESDGWISADLHVHAQPSHDSGILLVDRVRTMVAEGVEFFSSTDHDYVTDYAPVVEQLGVEEWVQTAVGVETTTVEVGHFLGFPLVADHLAEAGGAIDWTGRTAEEMFADMARLGRPQGYDPLITVAHPRAGILGYFDQYGFDPYAGQPGLGGEPGTPVLSPPLTTATNPLIDPALFSWDFDAVEVLGGKVLRYVRTPTQDELDRYADGEDVSIYEILERTEAEQADLSDGIYRLGYGYRGQVDDWFTLLNLGFKYTALGNSDTHGTSDTEAGCPRNFVLTGTDDPAYLDDQEVAEAVREHRVVASYGPFVRMWLDGADIGSEVVPADDELELVIEVQAPTWIDVDRVELYENGTLVREWALDDVADPLRMLETVTVSPAQDAWYVVMAMGDGDLAPVFTPVEIPYIELQMVVTEALAGVPAVSRLLSPAVPIPMQHPIHPFALTNPIWVDLDGDGFDAPGLPGWLERPVEPE